MNALVDHKAFAAATPVVPDVSLFDFKGHRIRVVTIGEEPWFVAKDVCSVLGTFLRTHKGYVELNTSRLRSVVGDCDITHTGMVGKNGMLALSEPALYKLVLRSDKPEAKPFQDWVTKEVLPAIRKDGAYIKGEEKVRSGEMSEDEFVLRAMEIMQGKIARLIRQQHQTP